MRAPVLWNYTLCGQYPGAVPNGATVSVQCTNVYEQALRFRYVIVQFPLINEPLNVCEIEVFTVGALFYLYTLNLQLSDHDSNWKLIEISKCAECRLSRPKTLERTTDATVENT